MKKPGVNRRLILIAFLVAVLLGGGSQAVALWQQQSQLTMRVSFGGMPPIPLACNASTETSHHYEAVVDWSKSHEQGSRYNVVVTINGTPVTSSPYSGGTSVTLQTNKISTVKNDVWKVAVTAVTATGWKTETASTTLTARDIGKGHPGLFCN